MAARFWSLSQAVSGALEDGDIRLALYWAWFVASMPILFAVAAPFLMPEAWLLALSPVCVWKSQLGVECPGCGLTRAFVEIGRFEFGEALRANRASLAIYALFLTNSVVLLAAVCRSLRR